MTGSDEQYSVPDSHDRHCTDGALYSYAQGRLTGDERDAVVSHLAVCERCRLSAESVRHISAFLTETSALQSAPGRPLPVRALATAAPIALALVGLGVYLVSAAQRTNTSGQNVAILRPTPEPSPRPTPSSPPGAIMPRTDHTPGPDVRPHVHLALGPRPTPAPSPRSHGPKNSGAANSGGSAGSRRDALPVLPTLPMDDLRALQGEPTRLASGDTPTGGDFRLRAPVGVVVESDRPTLRWEPVVGAREYQIELLQESADRTITATIAGDAPPEWTSHALARGDGKLGETYAWRVQAFFPDTPDGAAAPPRSAPGAADPPARFRVLSRRGVNALARAGADPLARGLIYARYGLLSEALDTLRTAAQDPKNSAARRARAAQIALRIQSAQQNLTRQHPSPAPNF